MLLQRYVSPDLTHFVGQKKRTLWEQYKILKKILRSGTLRARKPIGLTHVPHVLQIRTDARFSDNKAYLSSIVCFCDIPLSDLYIHMQKYSRFGLAFAKEFLLEAGATPVMYIPTKARPSLLPFPDFVGRSVASTARAFDEFFKRCQKLASEFREIETDADASADLKRHAKQFLELVEFLDIHVLSHAKFFDPSKEDWHKDNYYMEREWRVEGNVSFDLSDVARVIVPEAYGRQVRKDFPEYDGEVIFADWQ